MHRRCVRHRRSRRRTSGWRRTLRLAQNAGPPRLKEAISYTVPAAVSDAPAVLPAARLTNYVFAHSNYSSGLGQNNVLSGLLTDADEQDSSGYGRPADSAAVPPPAQRTAP